MLWAKLSLVLPVTFGHIAACRSAALALSAAIHFVMKNSAPCFAVLCHSPSSWAAIVHLSRWMPKTLRSSRRHPIHSFLFPRGTRTPHEFPEHHALRQSRVLHARYKPREQDPQYRLDGLVPRLHENVEVGDRVSCKDDMPSENKCESLHSNPILNMSCLCCFFNVCLVFFPRSTDYRRDWRPYTVATDGARNALKV